MGELILRMQARVTGGTHAGIKKIFIAIFLSARDGCFVGRVVMEEFSRVGLGDSPMNEGASVEGKCGSHCGMGIDAPVLERGEFFGVKVETDRSTTAHNVGTMMS